MSDKPENESELKDEPQVLGVVNHVGNAMIKLAILAVFVFALIYGTKTAYDFGYSVFTTDPVEKAPGHNIEVTILTGMSRQSVGTLLAGKGVIRNATVFYVQAVIYGYTIEPGAYVFNTSMTVEEILMQLAEGPPA